MCLYETGFVCLFECLKTVLIGGTYGQGRDQVLHFPCSRHPHHGLEYDLSHGTSNPILSLWSVIVSDTVYTARRSGTYEEISDGLTDSHIYEKKF